LTVNLMSFRHRYPLAGQGRGVFAVGGSGSADGKASRGSFNALSSNDLSSTGHSGSAVMPYVYGFGGDAPDGGYNGRGSLASGANGEGSGYDGRGVLAFTRGIEGGFGGWEGQEYTGPYGETTIDYTYGDVNGEYPHAVTARSNGDSFTYDAIGNMTSRTQGGVTWTQVFDAENRLVAVSDGTSTTTYVYDGSGGRLKRIVSEGSTITTTLYVAGLEIET
jgi:YD repeat-containing protein